MTHSNYKYFRNLDLCRIRFNLICIHEADKNRATSSTTRGHEEYIIIHNGFTSVPGVCKWNATLAEHFIRNNILILVSAPLFSQNFMPWISQDIENSPLRFWSIIASCNSCRFFCCTFMHWICQHSWIFILLNEFFQVHAVTLCKCQQ